MFTLNEALKIAGLPQRQIVEEKDEVEDIFDSLSKNVHPDGKISDDDADSVKGGIKKHLKAGWTRAEIVAFMRNMEEVNPDMDEDKALKRMKEIRDKVEARLAAEKK